jgi:hypothetical protein
MINLILIIIIILIYILTFKNIYEKFNVGAPPIIYNQSIENCMSNPNNIWDFTINSCIDNTYIQNKCGESGTWDSTNKECNGGTSKDDCNGHWIDKYKICIDNPDEELRSACLIEGYDWDSINNTCNRRRSQSDSGDRMFSTSHVINQENINRCIKDQIIKISAVLFIIVDVSASMPIADMLNAIKNLINNLSDDSKVVVILAYGSPDPSRHHNQFSRSPNSTPPDWTGGRTTNYLFPVGTQIISSGTFATYSLEYPTENIDKSAFEQWSNSNPVSIKDPMASSTNIDTSIRVALKTIGDYNQSNPTNLDMIHRKQKIIVFSDGYVDNLSDIESWNNMNGFSDEFKLSNLLLRTQPPPSDTSDASIILHDTNPTPIFAILSYNFTWFTTDFNESKRKLLDYTNLSNGEFINPGPISPDLNIHILGDFDTTTRQHRECVDSHPESNDHSWCTDNSGTWIPRQGGNAGHCDFPEFAEHDCIQHRDARWDSATSNCDISTIITKAKKDECESINVNNVNGVFDNATELCNIDNILSEQCTNMSGTWGGTSCLLPPTVTKRQLCESMGYDFNDVTLNCKLPEFAQHECVQLGGTWDSATSSCQLPDTFTAEELCTSNQLSGTWDNATQKCTIPDETIDVCRRLGIDYNSVDKNCDTNSLITNIQKQTCESISVSGQNGVYDDSTGFCNIDSILSDRCANTYSGQYNTLDKSCELPETQTTGNLCTTLGGSLDATNKCTLPEFAENECGQLNGIWDSATSSCQLPDTVTAEELCSQIEGDWNNNNCDIQRLINIAKRQTCETISVGETGASFNTNTGRCNIDDILSEQCTNIHGGTYNFNNKTCTITDGTVCTQLGVSMDPTSYSCDTNSLITNIQKQTCESISVNGQNGVYDGATGFCNIDNILSDRCANTYSGIYDSTNKSCELPETQTTGNLCTTLGGSLDATNKCTLPESAENECGQLSGTWDSATSSCQLPETQTTGDLCTQLHGTWDPNTNKCNLPEFAEHECVNLGGTWDSATSRCNLDGFVNDIRGATCESISVNNINARWDNATSSCQLDASQDTQSAQNVCRQFDGVLDANNICDINELLDYTKRQECENIHFRGVKATYNRITKDCDITNILESVCTSEDGSFNPVDNSCNLHEFASHECGQLNGDWVASSSSCNINNNSDLEIQNDCNHNNGDWIFTNDPTTGVAQFSCLGYLHIPSISMSDCRSINGVWDTDNDICITTSNPNQEDCTQNGGHIITNNRNHQICVPNGVTYDDDDSWLIPFLLGLTVGLLLYKCWPRPNDQNYHAITRGDQGPGGGPGAPGSSCAATQTTQTTPAPEPVSITNTQTQTDTQEQINTQTQTETETEDILDISIEERDTETVYSDLLIIISQLELEMYELQRQLAEALNVPPPVMPPPAQTTTGTTQTDQEDTDAGTQTSPPAQTTVGTTQTNPPIPDHVVRTLVEKNADLLMVIKSLRELQEKYPEVITIGTQTNAEPVMPQQTNVDGVTTDTQTEPMGEQTTRRIEAGRTVVIIDNIPSGRNEHQASFIHMSAIFTNILEFLIKGYFGRGAYGAVTTGSRGTEYLNMDQLPSPYLFVQATQIYTHWLNSLQSLGINDPMDIINAFLHGVIPNTEIEGRYIPAPPDYNPLIAEIDFMLRPVATNGLDIYTYGETHFEWTAMDITDFEEGNLLEGGQAQRSPSYSGPEHTGGSSGPPKGPDHQAGGEGG